MSIASLGQLGYSLTFTNQNIFIFRQKENMDTIMPIVAWLVVIALFAIPGAWGAVFTFSLLAHLVQFIPGLNKNKEPEKI